jgi:hypothetical protein
MDFKQGIRSSLVAADYVAFGYLADLTAEEMLVRPVPDANHVAWQLGHVIWAERSLIEAAVPGSMPPMPEGFGEKHGKGTSCSDDPQQFLSKEEYMALAKTVRAATLKALDQLSPEDFDKPVSGKMPPFVKCVGDCFVILSPHWVGHAGQWVVLRRKLARPRQF